MIIIITVVINIYLVLKFKIFLKTRKMARYALTHLKYDSNSGCRAIIITTTGQLCTDGQGNDATVGRGQCLVVQGAFGFQFPRRLIDGEVFVKVSIAGQVIEDAWIHVATGWFSLHGCG